MSDAREKLTPVYVVQIFMHVTGTGFYHNEKKDRHGIYQPTPMSAVAARNVVAKYEKEKRGARAYQYGWKERGYRSGETMCTELCRNKHWERWTLTCGG